MKMEEVVRWRGSDVGNVCLMDSALLNKTKKRSIII